MARSYRWKEVTGPELHDAPFVKRVSRLANGVHVTTSTFPAYTKAAVHFGLVVAEKVWKINPAGIHFFEHLASMHSMPADLKDRFDCLAEGNVITTSECMYYDIEGPSESIFEAVRILAGRLRDPDLSRDRIRAEKSNVQMEKLHYANSAEAELERIAATKLNPRGDLRTNEWGTAAALRSITVRQLRRIMKECHNPPRFVVAYVGPESHEEVVKQVREIFGWIKVRKEAGRSHQRVRSGITMATRDNVRGVYLGVAIPIRGLRPMSDSRSGIGRQYVVTEVLSAYLAAPFSGRLVRATRDKGWCYWIECSVDVTSDADTTAASSCLWINAHVRRRDLPKLVNLIFRELSAIRDRGLIDSDDYSKAVAHKRMKLENAKWRPGAHAEKLFEGVIRTGAPLTFESFDRRYARMRPEHFAAIAKQVLSRPYVLALLGKVGRYTPPTWVREMCRPQQRARRTRRMARVTEAA